MKTFIYKRGFRKQNGEREIIGKGLEVIDWWIGQESTAENTGNWDFYNPYKPNFLYAKRFLIPLTQE